MKRVTKFKITIIAITTIALGSAFTAYAANELQSHGRFEYKSDPSSTTADVVLDSEDLNTIYTEVKDGKTALATSINTATGTNTVSTNVNSLPTFEQLSNAIDYVKQAGVDEAYHQIATSPNLDSGTYGSVTDLASLESAITQDNNNYREQIIEEIKADPESYGICAPVRRKLLGTYSLPLWNSSNSSWSTNISTASIPNWNTLTNDNFVIELGSDVIMGAFDDDYDRYGRHNVVVGHNYNATTGTLSAYINIATYACETYDMTGTVRVYCYY